MNPWSATPQSTQRSGNGAQRTFDRRGARATGLAARPPAAFSSHRTLRTGLNYTAVSFTQNNNPPKPSVYDTPGKLDQWFRWCVSRPTDTVINEYETTPKNAQRGLQSQGGLGGGQRNAHLERSGRAV